MVIRDCDGHGNDDQAYLLTCSLIVMTQSCRPIWQIWMKQSCHNIHLRSLLLSFTMVNSHQPAITMGNFVETDRSDNLLISALSVFVAAVLNRLLLYSHEANTAKLLAFRLVKHEAI